MKMQIFLQDCIQWEVSVAGGESCCPGLSQSSLGCNAPDGLQAWAHSWSASSPTVLLPCLPSFLGTGRSSFTWSHERRGDVQADSRAAAPWSGSRSWQQAVCKQTGKMFRLRSCRAMSLENNLNMACGQGEAETEKRICHKDISFSCSGGHRPLAVAFATCPQ